VPQCLINFKIFWLVEKISKYIWKNYHVGKIVNMSSSFYLLFVWFFLCDVVGFVICHNFFFSIDYSESRKEERFSKPKFVVFICSPRHGLSLDLKLAHTQQTTLNRTQITALRH
jgi:hypothetical protein